ncbi:MAG: integrase [Pseudomonas sp.]|nr:integrase [Pseudomonas sp.]
MKAKPGHTHKWMSEVAIWGHGSLLARITPAGDRLFYFQYSSEAGKRYALPIGTYGPGDDAATMTLSDARQQAMELASLHKTGIKNIRGHLEAEEAARVAARDAKLRHDNRSYRAGLPIVIGACVTISFLRIGSAPPHHLFFRNYRAQTRKIQVGVRWGVSNRRMQKGPGIRGL